MLHDRPIFIENPDGSLSKGVPQGFKESTPPSTPRVQVLDTTMVDADIVRVLARHETLFLALLLLDLIVECSFEAMHMSYRDDAIFELSLIYPSVSKPVLCSIYWCAFVAEFIYCAVYFVMGVTAAVRSKPHLYHRFSTIALMGTLGQLPLAYLNRFNLLIFFLRFIAYAYARFQWNLLQGIMLIREELVL